MKINQDLRVNVDKVRNEQRQVEVGSSRFQELVSKHDQKMQMEQLHKLMNEVVNAGDRLGRSRSFKDLAKFKTLVKKFIRETVDYGMELKQSHSWNQFGQGRSLKIVETIDEKLVELTEQLTEKEGNSIDLLGKIGEIKGLLINLYT
ncbi:YaaR family protein [Neobacillus sp. D3-1R]|uniref:YaaR family protein n=1 Tax=Neobacillus sp. D3-1R TaxID=3445778 RepID=UPI003FA08070